jgi:hypothetical protein
MANGYYTHTSYPATNGSGSSSAMRAELDAVMAGFALLPPPLGLGQQGFLAGFWTGGTFTNPVIQNGTVDSSPVGANVPSSGSFTTLASSGVASLSAGGSFKGTFTSLGGAILAAFLIQGGFIDAVPIGNSTPSTGKFTTLNASGASTFSGQANFSSNVNIALGLAVASGTVEVGSSTVAGVGLVDFHSSGTNIDYDSRIIGTGGTGVVGAGTLSYFAAAHAFNTRPTFAGAPAWDGGNLPHPMQTTGATMTGTLQTAAVQVMGASSIELLGQGNTYAAFLRADVSGLVGFINNAQSAWNMQITDAGVVSFPRARPNWAGLTPWDNGNLTALSQLANNTGYITAGATVAGANSVNGITFAIAGQGGTPPWVWGYDGSSLQQKLWQPANMSVNFANSAGSANSVAGVSAPATRGANGSSTGIGAEIGPLTSPGTGPLDAPAPWVMGGVRCGAWKGPSGDCVGALYVRLTQVQQA